MEPDISFLAGHDLAVYSATWCPDCTRLKRWLASTKIATHEVNIDSVDGAAEKLEEETGKRAIPYVLVDGRHWVREVVAWRSKVTFAEQAIDGSRQHTGHK